MRSLALILCLFPLLLPVAPRADTVRLPCVADTNLSSYEGEQELNYGQSSRLRLKGIQMLALLRFDLGAVRSWQVEKATLYLRYAGSDRKLRTLGFSTVSAPWEEGSGAGERKPGEVCFAWQALGSRRWAGPETDFTDVSYTAGHTLAGYADLRETGDGWFAVDVPPALVQAMVAGVSYGLAVSDEKGQTMANNDVYSREQADSAPYLEVSGRAVAQQPPAAPKNLRLESDARHADFSHGAVRLTLEAPSRAFTYVVGYTISDGAPAQSMRRSAVPFAAAGEKQVVVMDSLPPSTALTVTVSALSTTGEPGPAAILHGRTSAARFKPDPMKAPVLPPNETSMRPALAQDRLRVWAYPDTEKAHPVSGNLLEEVGLERYAGEGSGTARQSNAVWNGRKIRLSGARNEILGFHLCVEAMRGSLKGVQAHPPEGERWKDLSTGSTLQMPGMTFFRDWYVKDGEWYPEACVPLTGAFDIPTADNAVPGQRNQSLFVEMLIPRDAPPGIYGANLTVSAEEVGAFQVPIEVTVNRLTLPDTLSFDISLNTYGTLGGPFGLDDRTPEYRRLEREYHRLAHRHRATLAILGYSHGGTVSTNYAPPLAGDGAAMRVTDWSAWDTQFGPYFDGSAFADMPRAGVPITHFYLPFHEAWPGDIRAHYRWQPTTGDYPAMIVEHAMKAPPIEQAMDKEMGEAFTAVMRQFAQHCKNRGWTRTQFQFYQNDKHYYKDPKQGGRGTSWWLLDEPNYRDDWLALAYFARGFRAAMQAFPGVSFVHREDISRPQWQRDYLDGLVDLMVVSNELYNKGPLLRDMRDRLGVRYWNYGAANPVRRANLDAEAWAVRAWLAGADAIVPWQSVGGDENYQRADETALLLPGKRFGITGPVASLRLKALRRAQQDAEYLALLAKGKGWDREQVAAAIGDLLKLQGTYEQNGAEDAGRYRFGPLRAADFSAMRQAVAGAADSVR